MRDIEEVCDRVLFLHHGRILAEGTADEITSRFAEQNLENVFIRIARSGERSESLRAEPGCKWGAHASCVPPSASPVPP